MVCYVEERSSNLPDLEVSGCLTLLVRGLGATRVPAKLSGDLECAQRAEGVAGVVA